MIISPSNINFFITSLETRFWTAFDVNEAWHQRFATVYNVDGEQWVSVWIGMLDKYREWIGPRKTHQPAPQTYLVPIKNWELTEELDEFRLADSTAQTAMSYYAPTVAFMGMQARKLWDYQLRDLLLNLGAMQGAFQNGTDGLTHWNTAHQIDFYDSSKGTYTNDYRGTVAGFGGIQCGGTFSTTAFNTIWEDMASRRSESNESLGIEADFTMVPPQLKAPATTILQSQFYAPPQMGTLGAGTASNAPFVGAMDNPLKGWTDLYVNKDLTNANDWFMMVTRAPIKPFSMLIRLMPDFVPRVNPDDPVVFNMHKMLYGSKARGTAAWSLPWLSSISGPTASA